MASLIIVVPDEQLRKLIELILREAGYGVAAAAGRLADVNAELLGAADVLVCHLSVLTEAGQAGARLLRDISAKASIVGVSASSNSEKHRKLQSALGLTCPLKILEMPFTIESFLTAVSQALS